MNAPDIELDFYSDTITVPTPRMRDAMRDAEVGDDVLGLDRSVRALEEQAAERVGKEAAVFVASGTMANFCALLAHTEPGAEIVVGDQSHMACVEKGPWRLAGFERIEVPNREDGGLDFDGVRSAVSEARAPRLLTVENTHNFRGGRVLDLAAMEAHGALAQELGLPLHLDGARLFNAEVATGTPAAHLAAVADTLCFCLSKGLGAPIGSLVCGSSAHMERAREARAQLGGGWRQAGVIAAAGRVALETRIERLAVDHDRAQQLASGLAALGLSVDPRAVESNIVLVELEDAVHFANQLSAQGVKISRLSARTARFVLHVDLPDDAVERALAAVERAL